tara:strand:+ start:261 stop:1400 length:1140 start_codon:yes stop_codon:yes gene_type:complete
MKKTLIIFLLLSSCSSATVDEEVFAESPEIYINCNYVDAPDAVKINVDISIFSNSEKLINGSIKGSGVAKNFNESLDDIDKNSSFSAEYVFTALNNGTFSFILNFDGIKSYRVDCSDKISSIITVTTTSLQNETTTTITTKSNQTTTTTKPKQTTTTTTTLPYVDYKQYDINALKLFLEVGFFYEEKVWRFEPENFSTVKIYSSPNANSDDGLDNLLRTIPYKYSQLDIPLVFEYIDNQDYKEGSAEFWYTNDGYTHPELLNGFPEGTSCGGNTGYYYDFSYNFEQYRITSIQVNICISGNGFQQKKAFIQDGLMNALGFNRVQSGSEFEYYGGYLQPQYIKYKEDFNELDKQLIQILYDPRVFRGMTKEQFKEVFQLP